MTSVDSTVVEEELRSGPCTFLQAVTSADLTLVEEELRSSPYTFLLVMGQVQTLPWWWQSTEVVPVPSYLSCDKC